MGGLCRRLAKRPKSGALNLRAVSSPILTRPGQLPLTEDLIEQVFAPRP